MDRIIIVGAGIAGCECALKLARYGFNIELYEQKPIVFSPAHKNALFSELVCSNSLRSDDPKSAIGLLKEELRLLKSHFMTVADSCKIPAGQALAVDRELFSSQITASILNNPNIQVRQEQVNDPCFFTCQNAEAVIIAAGPLASDGIMDSLARITGDANSYFYDAIAPIIWTDSLDRNIVFRASRYDSESEGDYLNCPMNREEYENFYGELIKGEIWKGKTGEKENYFEGCMPLEVLASRGLHTLVFGPMKPVGLIDPKTGKRPWAVLQLRPENANIETCNLVGCQTKLLQSEQKRIFHLVPGMAEAEFVRYGSMHRNSYLNAPEVLGQDLGLKNLPGVFIAGQLSGVEGYVESAATGLWLALQIASHKNGLLLEPPPAETALGSLLAHLRRKVKNFQPSNATFGLMPQLEEKFRKKERKEKYSERSRKSFREWLTRIPKELLVAN